MDTRSLQFIGAACAAERLSGSEELRVRRVCTDSRHVQAGDLFFALPGERFDGHEFLDEAVRKGAVAVVVERGRSIADAGRCAVLVVAVGGSNGKTTTKELVASVLKRKFTTLRSESSYNNEIGVPLTLLRL